MIAAVELIEKNISEKETEINDIHKHYPVEVGDKDTWQRRNVLRLDRELQEMYQALEILKGASKRSSNVVENEQSREFCDKCGKDKYLNAYTPDEGLCMCKVPQQKS